MHSLEELANEWWSQNLGMTLELQRVGETIALLRIEERHVVMTNRAMAIRYPFEDAGIEPCSFDRAIVRHGLREGFVFDAALVFVPGITLVLSFQEMVVAGGFSPPSAFQLRTAERDDS